MRCVVVPRGVMRCHVLPCSTARCHEAQHTAEHPGVPSSLMQHHRAQLGTTWCSSTCCGAALHAVVPRGAVQSAGARSVALPLTLL